MKDDPSPSTQTSPSTTRLAGRLTTTDKRVGVLLVNLGTPDAAEPGAVRHYLGEFLSDKRVVDLPRAFWLPVLHGIILNTRPAKTARTYKSIWREDTNESPLRYFTRQQTEALADRLGDCASVDWAMRYGSPSIGDRLDALKKKGRRRILIVPLYPQYSATTTATVNDEAFRILQKMCWQPTLRIAPPFYDDDGYISALTAVTQRRLSELSWTPERVLISLHGLPQRYVDQGDPYYLHCTTTACLLRESLGWSEEFAPLTFQSKFGRAKWLEPATDATLEGLAGEGVKRVAVMTPGFVADCIESLEEIDIAGRKRFMSAGGEHFDAIPCLNDSPEMIAFLETIMRRETAGWIDHCENL